jgi:hypothetical protein
MSASATRRFGSVLLGVTSMAASLGAIAFLIASDVAVAEERPEVQRPAQAKVEAPATEQAQVQVQVQDETKPLRKARPSSKKRKRIDLGRFEGY